jgi:hypothetical protein
MKCQECQFENPAGAKFCNECGNEIELACPQCSNVNPAGSKFCNECGHNLAKPIGPMESAESGQKQISSTAILEPTPLPEGERRHATIVFPATLP